MPRQFFFTGNGKVWKDQELAAALHYLTLPCSLTPTTNLLQSPNRPLSSTATHKPRRIRWIIAGLSICSCNLSSTSACFQFEVLALDSSILPGGKVALFMSFLGSGSAILSQLLEVLDLGLIEQFISQGVHSNFEYDLSQFGENCSCSFFKGSSWSLCGWKLWCWE